MPINIKDLRQLVNAEYKRPDVAKVSEYSAALLENPKALNYVKTTRGLTDETIKRFHLGYRSDRDAISIPIFKDGTLVNIKYRHIGESNTRYTSESGSETWVFNDEAFVLGQKNSRILIVEGEFDAMAAWQAGVQNVISPASGKDSYGVWIEYLDKIPKVYIAYDNDKGGIETAKTLSERIGAEKCFEVKYPDGVKDANEFLLAHSPEEFRDLLNKAKIFASKQYKGLGDIITSLRNSTDDTIKVPFIPKVEIEKDWLLIISGRSNVGKTSYSMNVVDSLAKDNIPTLVMPFERGIDSVGRRYLQVKFNKTIQQLKESTSGEWDKMVEKVAECPVYFAMPKREEIVAAITKAHRLFGVRVVLIDHLDYIIRNTQGSKEAEIGRTLQELKRVAEELKVVVMIVTHIRKIDDAGALLQKSPGIEDLKGSASLYQDPECVIMLTARDGGFIKVDIVKNKGEMTSQEFPFDANTGLMLDEWGGMG